MATESVNLVVNLVPGDGWMTALLAHQERLVKALEAYDTEQRKQGEGLLVYREYLAVSAAIYRWAESEEEIQGIAAQRRRQARETVASMMEGHFPGSRVGLALRAGSPAMLEA